MVMSGSESHVHCPFTISECLSSVTGMVMLVDIRLDFFFSFDVDTNVTHPPQSALHWMLNQGVIFSYNLKPSGKLT